MHNSHARDRWLRDIEERQRNVVFPSTVQNEVRFWRNLGTTPWTTWTRLGLAILGVFVIAEIAVFAVAFYQMHGGMRAILTLVGIAFFWGLLFCILILAVQRALRDTTKVKSQRHHRSREP